MWRSSRSRRAKIRLPIHIDGHNAIRLLQRVVAAGETASDGKLSYRLYAGSAAVPGTATEAMRISSVVLPTEVPVVEAETGGNLSEGVSFRFTISRRTAPRASCATRSTRSTTACAGTSPRPPPPATTSPTTRAT